jgi:hypothetical protein
MSEYRSQQLTAPRDGVFKIKCGPSETIIIVKKDESIIVEWEPSEIPDSD